MTNWPLKDEARVMGIDDCRYIRGSRWTNVVMTVMRISGMIEGFLTARITTDGRDSSERIANAIMDSRFREQVRCIMSDGACLAGLNVLDLDDLYKRTRIPVITVSDEDPKPESIKKALFENFEDGMERYDAVISHHPYPLELRDGICYVREKGITRERALEIVERTTMQGRIPEPVRISHMVASIMYQGGEGSER